MDERGFVGIHKTNSTQGRRERYYTIMTDTSEETTNSREANVRDTDGRLSTNKAISPGEERDIRLAAPKRTKGATGNTRLNEA